MNKELGRKTKEHADRSSANKNLHKELTDQCKRILSNKFARRYFTHNARAFEKWRDWVESTKHQEKVVKRTCEHWKRHKFYFMKAAF